MTVELPAQHRKDLLSQSPADCRAVTIERAEPEGEEEEAEVRFCGFDHLVAMKEAAARPEDMIDLQRLRESRDRG